MKILLVYLLIGVIITLLTDMFWDFLGVESSDISEEIELDWIMRLEIILFWPIPVISVIVNIITGNTDDTGPGFGY